MFGSVGTANLLPYFRTVCFFQSSKFTQWVGPAGDVVNIVFVFVFKQLFEGEGGAPFPKYCQSHYRRVAGGGGASLCVCSFMQDEAPTVPTKKTHTHTSGSGSLAVQGLPPPRGHYGLCVCPSTWSTWRRQHMTKWRYPSLVTTGQVPKWMSSRVSSMSEGRPRSPDR